VEGNGTYASLPAIARRLAQEVADSAATMGPISHQTSAAEIENGRRFAGIIVIGLARWLPGNWKDS
jgi:hypothetical protein